MAKRTPSEYVCKVCGLPLTYGQGGWRHVTNQYLGGTCRRPPLPEKRSKYEAELRACVQYAVDHHSLH